MNKQDVITFFDGLAPQWDADMVRSDEIIGKILDNAGVAAGAEVLDVACGTGVLLPDYLKRGVKSVTAVDISPEMVKIAQRKFPEENVHILCGDIEEIPLEQCFDCIVVYNAFPHFPEPEKLIRRLAGLLKPGGRLTIAHGMSRAAIDSHHSGIASRVSVGLMHEDQLAELMAPYLRVITKISDERMYQLVGERVQNP